MAKLGLLFVFLSLSAWSHPMDELRQAYLNKADDYTPRTHHLDDQGQAKFVNHLIFEASPYLLQHAHNPVYWYGFSDEAFAKAKRENKPIFISIGYATCHWCHVMEEESFDDLEVATLMNQYFVAIKVDREVRPEVDATYMQVSQLLNGTGGWPLNAVLLPDGRAFFAQTYLPKERLLLILQNIHQLWTDNPQQIIDQAQKITDIAKRDAVSTQGVIDPQLEAQIAQQFNQRFDEFEGGFGQAPKFPNEPLLMLLLDRYKRSPETTTLNMIHVTLKSMASGGLYDVVGGGFHRYSVDNSYLVPHFEKMLYNQAQLARVYTQAYRLTREPLYQRIAKTTLDYTLRELQDTSGGFYSATDADSEGEEGVFFTWDIDELKAVLGEAVFDEFAQYFDLSSFSEFEGRHIIRYHQHDLDASDYQKIDTWLDKLYQIRSKRVPPLTDHKILLSWNALLIPSLLEAGALFDEARYTEAGIQLGHYLDQYFQQDGQWLRVRIDDQLQTPALFEDYAYLADAYLSLFDHTQDGHWLAGAQQLTQTMIDRFWDQQAGGFYSATKSQYLPTQQKEAYDGALPGANAIAYQVLGKLRSRTAANTTTAPTYAQPLLNAFATEINQYPLSYGSFVVGFRQQQQGELDSMAYSHTGKVRTQVLQLDEQHLRIRIDLPEHWHINAHQPRQSGLVGTQVKSIGDHWSLSEIHYPEPLSVKLGFADEALLVYKGLVAIDIQLTQQSSSYTPPKFELELQACTDQVCLAPETLVLMP